MRESPAKDEIVSFLKSGEPGQTTDIKIDTLKRAAQNLFTANGLNCPVSFLDAGGVTVMINREKVIEGGNPLVTLHQ